MYMGFSTSIEKLVLVPWTISSCSICILLNFIEILHLGVFNIYEMRVIRMVIYRRHIIYSLWIQDYFWTFCLSFHYIVHCDLTSFTHLHFNIWPKCCSFLNGESNFQGYHEEIFSCLNYKHFMKLFKFIKSEIVWCKIIWFFKKKSASTQSQTGWVN